jgi:nicotinamidase-related amidase
MSEALLVIDVQKDYFPGGRMELVNAKLAADNAKSLLTLFRRENKPVIHIQHVSLKEDATFFLPGTAGVEIHESVQPIEGEKVIVKHFPNSFRETELEQELRINAVTELVVCGMMSHMCVDSTVRAAFDKGFRCTVADDACATRKLFHGGIDVPAAKVHAAYMAALETAFAKVITCKEIVG